MILRDERRDNRVRLCCTILSETRGRSVIKHYKIEASADARGVITLTGEVDVWQHVVDIGHAAGKSGVKGVVNS